MEQAIIIAILTMSFAVAISVLLARKLEVTLKPFELSLKASR